MHLSYNRRVMITSVEGREHKLILASLVFARRTDPFLFQMAVGSAARYLEQINQYIIT